MAMGIGADSARFRYTATRTWRPRNLDGGGLDDEGGLFVYSSLYDGLHLDDVGDVEGTNGVPALCGL